MAEPTVRVMDDSGQISVIPARELSDYMIAAKIEGIEGTVYIDKRGLNLGEVRHK